MTRRAEQLRGEREDCRVGGHTAGCGGTDRKAQPSAVGKSVRGSSASRADDNATSEDPRRCGCPSARVTSAPRRASQIIPRHCCASSADGGNRVDELHRPSAIGHDPLCPRHLWRLPPWWTSLSRCERPRAAPGGRFDRREGGQHFRRHPIRSLGCGRSPMDGRRGRGTRRRIRRRTSRPARE
jgi:hypothetical protein